MAGDNGFQGSISAEENILHAISLLDRSMSEMVAIDSEDGSSGLDDKFVALRLQIDNLQAKCNHLVPDKSEFDGKDDEDYPEFYKKIDKAKNQYKEAEKDQNVGDLEAIRKYFTATLEAIYGLLARKGIYQAIGEKAVEDGKVDPRKNVEET